MIIELEDNVRSFYNQKILNIRSEGKEISDYTMTKFYEILNHLVTGLLQVHYSWKLYPEELDHLAHEATSSIVFRLHRGTLPDLIVAWTQYMKKVIHGCYAEYVASNMNPDTRPECELVSFIDEFDSQYGEAMLLGGLPDNLQEVLIQKETSRQYQDQCITEIKKFCRKDEELSMLGFLCYHYNLPLDNLPLSTTEKMLTELVMNSFDYYFRYNVPHGVVVGL